MLYNETKNQEVVYHVEVAETFFQRFKGLMLRKSMNCNEGLILLRCSSIHTWFMRFAIDVVFLDINHRVISMKEKIKPWRMVGFIKNAYITVELPEGSIREKQIDEGDILIFR